MLDRALRLIVTLTLLLFLVRMGLGVLAGLLAATLKGVTSLLASAGGIAGRLLACALVLIFATGLLGRFVQSVRDRISREQPGHRQGPHEVAGRGFADEVPVERTRTRPASTRRHRRS